MSNTSAVPHAALSCSQLEARLQHLQTLSNHVFDPDALAEIAVQIGEVLDQINRQGCFDQKEVTLTGTATVCTDPSFISQMAPVSFTAHLALRDASGAVAWEFDPFTVDSNTISQSFGVGGADITGFFDSASGKLELGTPINVATKLGSASGQLTLSTDMTIDSPCLGIIAGVPVSDPSNMAGSVTLVGSAKVSEDLVSVTAYLKITGTLSA
jgi:hypothetical protein